MTAALAIAPPAAPTSGFRPTCPAMPHPRSGSRMAFFVHSPASPAGFPPFLSLEETSLTTEETSPVIEETFLMTEETSPTVGETYLTVAETSSVIGETFLITEETSSTTGETSSTIEETCLMTGETSSVLRKPSPPTGKTAFTPVSACPTTEKNTPPSAQPTFNFQPSTFNPIPSYA